MISAMGISSSGRQCLDEFDPVEIVPLMEAPHRGHVLSLDAGLLKGRRAVLEQGITCAIDPGAKVLLLRIPFLVGNSIPMPPALPSVRPSSPKVTRGYYG